MFFQNMTDQRANTLIFGLWLAYFVAGILPHGMPEVKDVRPAITKEEEEEEELHNKGKKKRQEEEEKKRLLELSEEEKQVLQ